MPDRRKSLDQLKQEWVGCRRCVLGEKRDATGGRLAFGEGRTGGILFVGEGPGITEAAEGRPFVGPSGRILRKAINKLGIAEVSYISNVVICRSFGPKFDSSGQEMLRKNRFTGQMEVLVEDEPPPTPCTNACLARLYEEIYLVDPVLIVALGGEAAKALLRRSVKVSEKRGTTGEVVVPGAWTVPALTSTGHWARKVRGSLVYPTEQNYVRYSMLIVLHPAHVLRQWRDESHGNVTSCFIEDMHLATDTYYRFAKEIYGVDCVRTVQLVPTDIIDPNQD